MFIDVGRNSYRSSNFGVYFRETHFDGTKAQHTHTPKKTFLLLLLLVSHLRLSQRIVSYYVYFIVIRYQNYGP